jgi:hypothetical protein
MSENNREIHDLLVDYAGALRDGCIPDFLKSLTRNEANTIQGSYELAEATEVIRLLNGASFADAAVSPNVGLFIARVDAKIMSRKKQASAATRTTRKRQSNLYELE